MRGFAIQFGLVASVSFTLSCATKPAAAPPAAAPPAAASGAKPALVCTHTYAGQPQRLTVPPTRDPYSVKGTNVYDRFDFKVVYVDAPADVAGVRIYTYRLDDEGPVLIHEAKYPVAATNLGRYGFTGQHFVYDPNGRELSYHCGWSFK